MPNDLITAAELESFASTLFDDDVVDAAVLAVRNYLGWHVAPRGSRTVILDGPRTQFLALPTLDPEAQVTAVRDVSNPEPIVIAGWRKTGKPLLYREDGWPCGPGAIEVDLIDGFDNCPMDLRPLIATVCADLGTSTGGALKSSSVKIDDYAEAQTYDTGAVSTSPTTSWPYRIPRKTTA